MGNNTGAERRHDLDVLRVLSFGTLIIFHTSLVYGTKAWYINSSEGSRLIDLIAVSSHPWRMSLLFFISGLVTASLLKKRSVGEIRSARTRQLLLPFFVGVVLIVPPQIYFSGFNPFPDFSYWDFWKHYMVTSLRLEHMWFLAYLWLYIFAWSVLMPRLGTYWQGMSSRLAASLKGANLFVVPIVFLAALRLWLYPLFGETLVITTDFYAHALYFSMFIAGALVMDRPDFWQEIDRQRWTSVVLAAISLLFVAMTVIFVPRDQWTDMLVVAVRIARSVFQWCAIITLLAFARRLVNRPNTVVTYINRSILTYYVVHQTIIVIAAYYADQIGMLDGRSFLPIVIVTAITCALIAEAHKFAKLRLISPISRLAMFRRMTQKQAAPEAAG